MSLFIEQRYDIEQVSKQELLINTKKFQIPHLDRNFIKEKFIETFNKMIIENMHKSQSQEEYTEK